MKRFHALFRLFTFSASLAFWTIGCATVSPYNQSFVRIRTAHFDLVSSFDHEDTQELARRLEFFHAGAMWALQIEEPEIPIERTRVFAFDDRGLRRPFAIRGQDAFYLPTADSGIIVLRTDPEWHGRSVEEIQHRYAHRLIRTLAPHRRSLWLEEGLAQFASTIAIRGADVRVGAPVDHHALSIRDWSRSDYIELMGVHDLSTYTAAARADFEARSWVLVHMLDARDGKDKAQRFQRYLRAVDSGATESTTTALLGLRASTLPDQVDDYIRQRQFTAKRVQPAGWDPHDLEIEPLSRARGRVELAELALALERNDVASEYFSLALDDSPTYPDALAGIALSQGGPFESREMTARKALQDSDTVDLRVLTRLGDLYARGAMEAGLDSIERDRRIEEARTFYRRGLALDDSGIEARIGMARTYLLGVPDADAALRWLSNAKERRPGALVIDYERAKAQLVLGQRTNARRGATDVLSRTHSKSLRRKASDLVDRAAHTQKTHSTPGAP